MQALLKVVLNMTGLGLFLSKPVLVLIVVSLIVAVCKILRLARQRQRYAMWGQDAEERVIQTDEPVMAEQSYVTSPLLSKFIGSLLLNYNIVNLDSGALFSTIRLPDDIVITINSSVGSFLTGGTIYYKKIRVFDWNKVQISNDISNKIKTRLDSISKGEDNSAYSHRNSKVDVADILHTVEELKTRYYMEEINSSSGLDSFRMQTRTKL